MALAGLRRLTRPARARRARPPGRFVGIGIGNYVEGNRPRARSKASPVRNPAATARSRWATGATTQGQGTHTTLFADRRRPASAARSPDIVMTVGDTNAISQGVGAFASPPRRSTRARRPMIAGEKRESGRWLRWPRAQPRRRRNRDRRGKTAAPVRPAGGKQAGPHLSARLARPRPGHARLLFCRGGRTPGPRAHRIFHAAPGVLLQRQPIIVEVEVDPFTGRGCAFSKIRRRPRQSGNRHQSHDRRWPGPGAAYAHGIGNALFEFMRLRRPDAQPPHHQLCRFTSCRWHRDRFRPA